MFEKLTSLGTGGAHQNTILPRAIAELQGLQITGPVDGAGAGVPQVIAGMDIQDTIVKVINLTDMVEVALNTVAIMDRRARGIVELLDTLANNDTVTVNGKVYTFKAVAVTPSSTPLPYNQVPITVVAGHCDEAEAAARLATAIMCRDSALTVDVALGVVTIHARVPGVAGNAFTLATSGAHATVSGATFAGGLAAANCGMAVTGDTTAKKLLTFWFKKSRAAGQWQ